MTSDQNVRGRSQDAATKDMLGKLMLLRLEELVNTANDLSRATQSRTLERRYFVQQIIMAVGILGVAIIFINVHLIRKSVVQPLKRLSKGAEKIGAGDFVSVPKLTADDEVGSLSRAFNSMVARLQDRDMTLKQARDEISSALEERSAALGQATAYNKLLQTIQSVQTQFISNARAEELFPVLLVDLLTLSESEFGFVGEILYTETGQPYLKNHAITDISWDKESTKIYEKFARDRGLESHDIRGLWGTAILSGEPVIANDPATDPRRSGLPTGHPALDSFLGLPFRSDGEVIGMAGIANRPGGYDQDFVDFLKPFVSTCANIIEAYRNENRRRQAEEALQEAKEHLEIRVRERTAELEQANRALQQEMAERRRAEEDVAKERQRFYDILEILPAYVVLMTPDHHISFANRFFRERFGEYEGLRCFEYLFGLSEPCEICEPHKVLKTMAPHHWEWTGPDNRNYDIYDFPFTDTDGSSLIMEVGIDITELKQTLAELTRSNAELEQFAYVASHDLQEPLRNVSGCLQLLEKKYQNTLGSDADQYIRYAVDSGVRMKELIQDLLAYSRIGTRGKPPAPTNCEEILQRAQSNLESASSQAGASITHDPLPTVLGDDTQLLQVFQNLIGNSIKFRRDEPPHVHIS
ncbi:MAG: GAF domain-containing protein, partial [Deltaproteobacteria bacterium]